MDLLACSYLHDPYLIDGGAVQVRVFATLTSLHPLRCYLFTEGCVRLQPPPYALMSRSPAPARVSHIEVCAVMMMVVATM